MASDKSLAAIVIDENLATPKQIEEATASHRGRLDRVLVEAGVLNELQAARVLSIKTGLPVVDLATEAVDRTLLEEVPSKFMFRHAAVPLQRTNGTVRVAVADPYDIYVLDELRLLIGAEVEPVLAPRSDIARFVKTHYGIGGETLDQMAATAAPEDDVQVVQEIDEDDGENLELARDASLIRLVNEILIEALQRRATDVHVEPREDDLRIRYRVDGMLHTASLPPRIKQYQSAIVSRLKIMSQLNIAEKRLPQDGRVKLEVEGREIDLRVSIIPMLFGEGVVLRILDTESIRFGLADLGMGPQSLRLFERIIRQPHGILLVTGPTGSGKTTTLYAALAAINREDLKIVTIEDPVEYHLEGINQIQVKDSIGLTFARGLRHILRHDPDVIMIGEIRDYEAGETAMQASMTGHLVFSTLHTNDAAGAFTRLVDMGVEPYLVASSLEGAMAQRLVRRICPHCKEETNLREHPLPEEVVEHVKPPVYHGRGCDHCLNTGYRGRLGIFELLPVNDEIRELVLKRVGSNVIREAGRQGGMMTLREDGWQKVMAGITTVEEVLRVTKEDVALKMRDKAGG
jgi:type II secretion system protein E